MGGPPVFRFRRSRALAAGAALLLGAGLATTTHIAQAAPSLAEAPQDAGYAPVTPARLLDTRVGGTTIDAQQAGGGPVASGTVRGLPVLGRGGVPATGVEAVAVNITVTGTAGGGFLSVWPGSTSQPNASTLNYDSGDTLANFTIIKVGANGQINLSP